MSKNRSSNGHGPDQSSGLLYGQPAAGRASRRRASRSDTAPELTPRQIEARRTPPSREECLAARRSEADEPRLCSRYGIPRPVVEEAHEASAPYAYSPNIFYKRILEHLYPPGTRVTLTEPLSGEENPRVVPGCKGTVTIFDDSPSFGVRWDNGSRLSLIADDDVFTCDPPSDR